MQYPSIRWAFNIKEWKPTKEQWKLATQCIQKEEKERCHRFVFVEDCKSSMVSQLLMRKAASECLDIQYNKLNFARTSSGKPYLINGNGDLFFNVSHNGDVCVLAAERDFNVGVDVMKAEHRGKKPVSEFFCLMRKQFSSSEWDFITLPGLEKDQLQRFFRLWCLKESYVKATGTGIACDLQSLSFSCLTPVLNQNVFTTDTKLFKNGILQSQWKFDETLLDANHLVAVALEPIPQITEKSLKTVEYHPKGFSFLTFDELVKNCIPFETADEHLWNNFASKSEKEK